MEPMLEPQREVRLLHPSVRIIVKVIHRANHVKRLTHRHTTRHVGTEALHVAVLAAQHLAVHARGPRLPVVHALHTALPFRTRRPAVALVVIPHLQVGVILRLRHSVARAQLTRDHHPEVLHRAHVQARNHVLLVVLVLHVDTLTLHHGQLIVEMILQQVAIDHHAQVAPILHPEERIATAPRQVSHALRIHVDELHLRRRERILQRVRVLELSHAHGQRPVVRDPEVRVELLHHRREVVHEHKRPPVRDTPLHPEEHALQVQRVRLPSVLLLPCVTRLPVAVELKPLRNVGHPVRQFDSFLLILPHGRKRHQEQNSQKESISFH